MQSALQSAARAGRDRNAKRDTYRDEAGVLRCSKCGGMLEFIFNGPDGREMRLPCMCECDEVELREKARREKEAKDEKLKRSRVSRAFVSPSMREKTFESDDGRFGSEQMRIARKYAERLSGDGCDFGLLFFGPPDSGKTFISCCIANMALDAGMSVAVRSTPQILQAAREDEHAIKSLLSVDLLVVDDLGAERSTSYGQEQVYALVDGRYQTSKPMVVSTNLTRAELATPSDTMSARIYGRILEMCLPVEVDTGRRRATRERYADMRKALGI